MRLDVLSKASDIWNGAQTLHRTRTAALPGLPSLSYVNDVETSMYDARTIFVADLPGRLSELPTDHEITVLCKAGSRATIAASILDGAGVPVRLVASGGATGWAERFAALEASRTVSNAAASGSRS